MTSVIVTEQNKTVVVTEETGVSAVVSAPSPSIVVKVLELGPQGPAGAGAYIHQQLSASALWTINHNLGFKPSVELFNSGSQEIEGDVVHTSDTQTLVLFTLPLAGFARLI